MSALFRSYLCGRKAAEWLIEMKIKISKGSVQETLLIPLYGRKMAMDLYPDLFSDADCQRLFDSIDFDAPKMSCIKAKIGAVIQLIPLNQ